MNILSVESSCDETAVAIVRDGREILTDCIASQVELHKLYGGVVPEIASRSQSMPAITNKICSKIASDTTTTRWNSSFGKFRTASRSFC